MAEYNFDVTFQLTAGEDPKTHLDPLFEAGCDDALVGVGRAGQIALDFAREADSAFAAVTSAIAAVKQAIPHARLVAISPDLVGVSELAALFGVSRQYMRRLLTESDSAPSALRSGSTEIYRYVDVVSWLLREDISIGEVRVTERDYELADVITNLNSARENVSRVLYRERPAAVVGDGTEAPGDWSRSLLKKLGQEICPRYQKLLGERQLRLLF